MNMMDIAALNAFVILMHKKPDWKKTASHKRKLFINNLGKYLVLHDMTMRANIKQIDTLTKSALIASDNGGSASGTDTRKVFYV